MSDDCFSTAANRKAYAQAKANIGIIAPTRTMVFQTYNRVLYGLRMSLDLNGEKRLEIWYKYQTHKGYTTPYEMIEGKWNLALVMPKRGMDERTKEYLLTYIDSKNKEFHQKLVCFWNKQVPKMVHCLNSPKDTAARCSLSRMTMKMLPVLNVENHGTQLRFSQNAIRTLLLRNLL